MADHRPPDGTRSGPEPYGIPQPALDALTRTLDGCLRGEAARSDLVRAVRSIATFVRAGGAPPEAVTGALTRAYRAVPEVERAAGSARDRLLVRVAALCIEAYYEAERAAERDEEGGEAI
jgi:hypothetical protein